MLDKNTTQKIYRHDYHQLLRSLSIVLRWKALITKQKKKQDGNAIGCFIGYALLGLTITAGVAMALLISGESNFFNFVLLLGLLNVFSYLLLKGEDFQERFHFFTRIAATIILLEIILVVGLIITEFAGLPTLSRDNVLVPLMMIAGYEGLKQSLRSIKKRRSMLGQTQV